MVDEHPHGREIMCQLLENNIEITGMLVERGNKLAEAVKGLIDKGWNWPPSMYDMVRDRNIPVYFTSNFNNKENVKLLKSLNVKLIVLGGANLLKSEIIECAPRGILNAHPGLLPEYRGMDIVGWSILNGDSVGSTCHFIVPAADAGPILLRRVLQYEKGDSLLDIRIKNTKLCAELMTEAVKNLENIKPQPQDLSKGKRYFPMSADQMRQVEEILLRAYSGV